MLTSSPPAELARDARPSYRPYRASVVRIEQISPSFRRVTFTGPDFGTFGTAGLDQRIKIVLPHDDGSFGDPGWFDPEVLAAGTWYQRWRDLPDHERNPFRTYTVRAIRQAERELDVDFVVHGHSDRPDAGDQAAEHDPAEHDQAAAHGPAGHGRAAAHGPAARWLESAAPGDEIVIVGPDDLSTDYRAGLDWHPGEAVDYLLAGDETAAPAICSILESLPAGTRAHAFIEVPHAADAAEFACAADARVTWLSRNDGGRTLDQAVRAWVEANRDTIAPALSDSAQEVEEIDVDVDMLWDSPEEAAGRFYAWLAGESAVIKGLRRLLVSEIGVDRRRVAFMGYWRLGKAEEQ